MAKGEVYPAERTTFRDPETGAVIHRLTNYRCHSNHLYFTHGAYYSGGRKLVFHSDRGNARNLFGLDLQTGQIQQLTGFESGTEGVGPFRACLNPVKDEAYLLSGRALHAIALNDLTERRLWEAPDEFSAGMPNCGADGAFAYFTLVPNLSKLVSIDPLRGRPENREISQARPHCRVVRVSTDGGDAETLWEGDRYIGHVNTSPTLPNVLTFCYEGPWRTIDQRIWGLDADTGKTWRIRPQDDGSMIGHEYWFADGTRVGYHGRISKEPGAPILWGYSDYEGNEFKDYIIPRGCMHYHSLGPELLVGDGLLQDPYLILWRWNGSGYDGRLLCRHLCSFHSQQLHVHPQMTPDGRGVIFTSDMHAYGNVYLVEIPEFESLPDA